MACSIHDLFHSIWNDLHYTIIGKLENTKTDSSSMFKGQSPWVCRSVFILHVSNRILFHGPLTRCTNLRVAHAPAMPGTFSQPHRVSDPDMHDDMCMTHVPWYMPGSLTCGFLLGQWRGKRSRHSRRMRSPQFPYLVRAPLVAILRTNMMQCLL